MNIKRISFSGLTQNFCPYSLSAELLGKSLFTVILLFHTNCEIHILRFLSATASFPSNVLSVT